ncbi:hypothetical protein B0T18DRAFT_411927 [Schizothecium vesticola]|uniref:Uncharacterized protein n=1 Tax=Schizothecium vesticola TaxID=314040 RepID=A0AA40EWH0_9PEZI|nr:hypothetical protein B0T18DRAFT_411927 [Schizothecium vesticola]
MFGCSNTSQLLAAVILTGLRRASRPVPIRLLLQTDDTMHASRGQASPLHDGVMTSGGAAWCHARPLALAGSFVWPAVSLAMCRRVCTYLSAEPRSCAKCHAHMLNVLRLGDLVPGKFHAKFHARYETAASGPFP